MIRECKEEDIESCLSIYNWYIQNSVATFEEECLSLSEFKQRVHRIQAKYPYLVITENGCVVGYAYLDAFNERAAYRWSADLSIYLDESKTANGYGSQLMHAILMEAEKRGFHNIVSIVTEGNLASERIHEKFGFEKEGFLKTVGYKKEQWLGVTFFVKHFEKK